MTAPRAQAGHRVRLAFVGVFACLLVAGSSVAAEEEWDPIEPVNRATFATNHWILEHAARPVARLYRDWVPRPVRDGFRNGLDNLKGPSTVANHALQGNAGASVQTLARFFLNSTVGVAGVVDVASRLEIPRTDTDLGITLAVWGVGEGPYIVLPLLGPSTPRDSIASFGEGAADPVTIGVGATDLDFVAFVVRFLLGSLDAYSRRMDDLRRIEETSIDFYAAIRSFYLQNRRAEVSRARSEEVAPAGIDYGVDLEEPEEPDGGP